MSLDFGTWSFRYCTTYSRKWEGRGGQTLPETVEGLLCLAQGCLAGCLPYFFFLNFKFWFGL